MFVCKPHIIVEKSSVSLDFECRGMALSSKFIDQLGRVADGGWDLEMFLGKNLVLSLSEDEISLFMQYYALLGSEIPQSVVFRQICEKNARNVAEGLPQVARRYCRRMIAERIRPELMPNVLAEKNR